MHRSTQFAPPGTRTVSAAAVIAIVLALLTAASSIGAQASGIAVLRDAIERVDLADGKRYDARDDTGG